MLAELDCSRAIDRLENCGNQSKNVEMVDTLQ